MPNAVFTLEGEHFVPTSFATSPWAPDGLHGGPPAGLLARAIEQSALAEDLVVARVTVDLFRQVPNGPLEVTRRIVREGRRIQATDASIWHDGVEVARASGVLLQRTEVVLPDDALPQDEVPPFPEVTQEVALGGTPSGTNPGFHNTVYCRRVGGSPGDTWPAGTAWIKIPCPLVEGEVTSPTVMVAAIADFTNALSGPRNAGVGFINCDISLHIGRPAEGEWVGLKVDASAQPNGIGIGHARVFDRRGLVGMVSVARLANRRGPQMPAR